MRILSGILFSVCFATLLSSCMHHTDVSTVLHNDGSIDRAVVLSLVDSSSVAANQFGLSTNTGWNTAVRIMSDEERARMEKGENSQGKFQISFNKHFPSIEEANKAMNTGIDSLFHIRSLLDRKFRWFYTYYTYSDTYVNVNRFHHIAADDYFAKEDHDFIERLPADGVRLTKADSVFLQGLNSKIMEDFFTRGAFEEYYAAFREVLAANQVEKRWLDTLDHYKEVIYQFEIKLGDKDYSKSARENLDEHEFFFRIADSLQIPLPMPKAKIDFESKYVDFSNRFKFMQRVATGKIEHSIALPATVISTNGDSVSGNKVFWKPRYQKFALTDYTMYAEYRTLNYIPTALSVLIIIASVFMIARRKGRQV